ncbi:MAG: class I SAM-dependent methyltransferase [Candidatus Gastranaerophilales bacterium]|nr:class I SAM-dependent methyltransferase [Candidatus Gastranaerophilales bacterium]
MNIVTFENTLAELEKTQKDFWNISRQTGNFLSMLIKMNNSQKVLEIGTSNGYSGLWILSALEYTGGNLTTIEYYDKRRSIAIENFNKCGFESNYTTLQGQACDILETFSPDKMFDFVFIDANKREYVKNFELIKPHLAEHAIIAADNINSHREKVQTFLDVIYSDKDFQTEILDLPAGLSVSYKIS